MEEGQSGKDGEIKLTFHGKVAVLKMCRSENRINFDFIDKMFQALDEVEGNPDVQVLVTTGEGKFYGNGLDLDWIAKNSAANSEFLHVFTERMNQFTNRLLTSPFVTVAAINGHAYAGGAVTALCHDYQVMRTGQGWWCLNEVHIGLLFMDYLNALFRMKLPSGKIRTEAAVLGRRYTAEEAKEAGIVQKICEEQNLIKVASDLGMNIVPKQGYDRDYLRNMKKDVYKHIQNTDDTRQFRRMIKSKV